MVDIDKTDSLILNHLQRDGKITIAALAQELSLSTTAVYERIRKLEKEGVIKKYVALLDPKKVQRNLIVYISISLKNHGRSHLE